MKDAYWFKHNSNARNDEKILDLRQELGYEGYGIYWALMEYLRDLEGYEGELKPKRISMALQAEEGIIEQVIKEYGLFVIKESGRFSSPELNEWMERMDEKRKINSENAKKKHAGKTVKEEESERTAIAEQSQSNRHTIREDNSTANKSTQYNKSGQERVQGEKGQTSFFSECLNARNDSPVILFFEYLFFLGKNKFDSVEEQRLNFISHWMNSNKTKSEKEIENRIAYAAKIGFNFTSEDFQKQLNQFKNNPKKDDSEADHYMRFLDQLKEEGFEPVEELKKIAGEYLKF